MWQEGREHEIEISDHLGQRVQDRGQTGLGLRVVALELEGLGVGDVLVGLADQAHRLPQGGLLAVLGDEVAHGGEAGLDGVEQGPVDVLQLGGLGDLPEALVDHGGGAVDQVAPAGHELAVGAPHELRPGEVRVRGLRAGRADEVAQGVGLVALEEVAHIDDDAVGGGELLALHGEELAGDDLGGQVEHAQAPGLAAGRALTVVAQELGGPDLGVEDDVVLAHEVVGQGLGVVPPGAPRLGVAAAARPLHGGGQVADDGVEPDVEALGGLVLPAGHRDAPVDVPGHGARADVPQEVLGELDDVGPPGAGGLALVEPGTQGLGQGGQVQEPVGGLHELGGLAVDPRARADEVGGVELVAAGVALVPAGALGTADRAGALDVAVGQGAPGGGGDRRAGHLLDHVAVVPHGGEHVLDHVVVVAGGGAGEQVVGQTQGHEVLDNEPVVAVGELPGAETLLVGGDEDRGAVLIGARDHEDVMTGHAHVA